MAEQGSTIFVSYARDDRKFVVPIIELLEAEGYSVWWDGLLEPGERFSRTTEAALVQARAVVVLWSKTSTQSHWVHDEATQGRDRRCLVPISIDGSEAPLGFRQFQVIDVSKSKVTAQAPAYQAVLRAVAALHDKPVEAPAKIYAKGPAIDRRMLLGGGAVIAGGGIAAWLTGLLGGKPVSGTSIAVLPFANLSGDPAQTYFSDGLAAEIRAQLARNKLLQVAAQASSNMFRDRKEDARTISKKLRVAYFLDGNVRRAGDTVKVAAELIDGKSGTAIWQQSFDRSLKNIFAVQSEIASAIGTSLSAEIGGNDDSAGDKKVSGGTDDVAAYDAFLRGKDLYEAGESEAGDRLALAKFDEAIAQDPEYAAAHAARSRSLAVIANQYAKGEELRSFYRDAVIAARRATRLAPRYAEAHSALGFALAFGEMDMRAARKPYELSVQLGGGDADILSRYAIFCSRSGRFAEAEKAITQSLARDPLNARTFRTIGVIKYGARRYDAAVAALRKGLELNPKLGGVRSIMGAALLMQGKTDEAKAAYAAETNSLFALPGKAIIAHREGDDVAKNAALDRLVSEHGSNGLYQQAQVYAQFDDARKSIAALLAAKAEGDSGLIQMYNDPLLDPVRKEPEFLRLLSTIGFV